MDLPDTLPGRIYLLAYPPDKDRVAHRSQLGLLLRAAALTDLLQRGLLSDQHGRARSDGLAPDGLAPVLAAVLDRIAASRPRSWEHWVTADERGTARAVRDLLCEQGRLDLTEYRVLGLFPGRRAVPRDPAVRQQLATGVEAALAAGTAAEVEPWQAAVVSLAAAAELRPVLSRRRQHEQRARIAELTAITGPVPPALRRAIRSRRAAMSS